MFKAPRLCGNRRQRRQARVLKADVVEQRRLLDRLYRTNFASDGSSHDLGCFPAALTLIDVRIRFVDCQRITVRDQLGGHVGVKVVRDNEGQAVGQGGSDTPYDLRIAVGMALAIHGSVQGKQHSIERRRGTDSRDEFPSERLESLRGDRTRRRRNREQSRVEIEAVAGRALDASSDFVLALAPGR